MSEIIRPHPLNVLGPFYVIDGCCTACDAPFLVAPSHFQYDHKDHCFVKRQPETKEELNRIMRAASSAELACIRYRGQNPEILRRFAERGERNLCDVAIPANVHPIFRNHATFDASSSHVASLTTQELALAFQEYLRSIKPHGLTYEFTPIVAAETVVSFSFSWYQRHFYSFEFSAVDFPDSRWLVRHLSGLHALSEDMDDWLKSDSRFCRIRWYSEEQWKGSKEWQDTPW